jgi:hypothetical protein
LGRKKLSARTIAIVEIIMDKSNPVKTICSLEITTFRANENKIIRKIKIINDIKIISSHSKISHTTRLLLKNEKTKKIDKFI